MLSDFSVQNSQAENNKQFRSLTSVLPSHKYEYSDGTNWFSLATENFVNMVVKQACLLGTTENLATTYNNGTEGVGGTLTSTTDQEFTLDGVTPAVGSRILVKDQTIAFQNGIYILTKAGSAVARWELTRATDYDALYLINPGDVFEVVSGTINGVTSWMQKSEKPSAIGTDSITFTPLAKGDAVSSVVGETNQIIATTTAGIATISFADNPVIPGTAGITLPVGSSAQRPANPPAGTLRFNNGT